jgi:hypothetical protein
VKPYAEGAFSDRGTTGADVSAADPQKAILRKFGRVRAVATFLPVILIFTFAIRIAFAWDQERAVPRNLLGSVAFLQETGNISRSLALGQGFSDVFRRGTGPTAWLTPVYPLLVAGIYRVFGIFTAQAFFVAALLNILFSTAATVPIFYAGKKIGGIGVASAAAWLWAVFPNSFIIPFEWIWDTCLSALLAATIVWATLKLVESERLRDWCGYGLLWGFTLMTNPALGSVLPFLLGWTVFRSRLPVRGRSQMAALVMIIVILCCTPWTVRNYTVFHRFIPLRSNLPFEIWLGNNPVFDEDSRDMMARVTAYGQAREYEQLGETAFMHEKWQEAIVFMRTHPALEIRLCSRRFIATWAAMSSPVRQFMLADSMFVRVVLVSNWLVTLGAAAGVIVLIARGSPFAFPLTVWPIVFPLVYYLTHASLRLRHPLDPVLMLLCASALVPGRLQRRLQI